MNGAQALVSMLVEYGVRVIFGLPGDTSVDLYDALRAQQSHVRHIMARDERSAAFMADVYARLTSKPGVCEAPSGGGATYMLPGVAEAHGSSVAFVALTTDNPIGYEAQNALTELDQPALYSSVTKWSTLVKLPSQLPHFVRRAFRMATSGRPGAVHIGLPKDVLAAEMPPEASLYVEPACRLWPAHPTRPAGDAVERAARLLRSARRPVILAGGGVISSKAFEELRSLAEWLSAPVVTTINGKGAIAETHPLCLGVAGANGGRPFANHALAQADVVLFIGTKANYVDTDMWRCPPTDRGPRIIQIDIDPSQLGNTYPIDEGLCGDARLALQDLLEAMKDVGGWPAERTEWVRELQARRERWRASLESLGTVDSLVSSPWSIVAALNHELPDDSVLICDPGTPTPYVAAGYEVRRAGRDVIAPRAHGGLGFAIPGVVGARLALPNTPIFGLCGDGSFAMSAGDLATVARMGGPTILLLFNNGCFGWIKALQHFFHGARYFGVDFTEPIDYVRIASGFGLRSNRVTVITHLIEEIRHSLRNGEPTLLELCTPPEHELIPPVSAWERAVGNLSLAS